MWGGTHSAIVPCTETFPPSVFLFKVVLRPNIDAEWAVETGLPPLLESTLEL